MQPNEHSAIVIKFCIEKCWDWFCILFDILCCEIVTSIPTIYFSLPFNQFRFPPLSFTAHPPLVWQFQFASQWLIKHWMVNIRCTVCEQNKHPVYSWKFKDKLFIIWRTFKYRTFLSHKKKQEALRLRDFCH